MATTTTVRTDEQILENVLAELKWDPRLHPNEIGVSVKNGIVTLFGWVDSFTKKWAAEEAAHRVRGVLAVANDLEVRLPAFAERTDADLAAAAIRALDTDAALPIEQLDMTVSDGWVTLQGQVDWPYQKEDAERVVRRLVGVRGVTNLLTVRRGTLPLPAPENVKRQVEQALQRSTSLDASRIHVEVKPDPEEGHKVILTGEVGSLAARREAERIAWSAPGITWVENHLKVTG